MMKEPLETFEALHFKTSIRRLSELTGISRDAIRARVRRFGLDPENFRGMDVLEFRPKARLEGRIPELLEALLSALEAAKLPARKRESLAADVWIAVAGWTFGALPDPIDE
jgi:DNA-binding Lrp family transcriptional regulator